MLKPVLTAAAVLLLLPITAAAQGAAVAPVIPRADVFGGVAIWHEDDGRFVAAHFNGAARLGRRVAVVGDVAFYDRKNTLMGGVRVYGDGPRVSVFGQFLIGTAPLDDIAWQPGFGVDVHLGRRAAVRAAFDVKISGDDGSTYIGTRLSTGIVVKLGRQ